MKPIPPIVVEIRRGLCADCVHLANDPCAACAHGKWDAYVRCEPDLPPLATMAGSLVQAAWDETLARLSGIPQISEADIKKVLEGF